MCFIKLFRGKRKRSSPPVIINVVDDEWLIDFCYNWNLQYPIDRWWREKHKVAFNSTEHRSISFLDMRFEFEEFLLFQRNDDYLSYVPDKGDYMRKRIVEDDSDLSEEERLMKYRKEFSEMDLSQFDDK